MYALSFFLQEASDEEPEISGEGELKNHNIQISRCNSKFKFQVAVIHLYSAEIHRMLYNIDIKYQIKKFFNRITHRKDKKTK